MSSSAELLAKILIARELGVPVRDVNSVLPKLFVELLDAATNSSVIEPDFVVNGTLACKPNTAVPLPEVGQVYVYEGNLCEVMSANFDMIQCRWLEGNQFGRKTLDFVQAAALTRLDNFPDLEMALNIGSKWHMPVYENVESCFITALGDAGNVSYMTSRGVLVLPKQDFLLAHDRALQMLEKEKKNNGT